MLNLVLFILAFLFMELVAWSNHKYIMHGFLWRWHKDHHQNDREKIALDQMKFSGLEKNDLFFLVYAIPAIILIITGLYLHVYEPVFIGAGISLYGLTYFLIHDMLIHKRIKLPFLQKIQAKYLKAVVEAHLAHHRPKNSTDFNNFGLLIFPNLFKKK
ncbi:MAG TPA: hypothetical protein DCQ31_16755 [Bacteroidales bacterium]|nr:hypothetical protein [Bacteroidales bacterium]